MYDFIVIGAGIVGVSTAWQLKQRSPAARVLLLEKEASVGRHQTGRNSGVIHAGLYYSPDSLKATFCREGVVATVNFCEEHGVAYERCGKLLVATDTIELERMSTLFARCQDNQIDTEMIDSDELRRREPNITGLGAIYSPSTGIVDFRQVCARMAALFTDLGGEIRFDSPATELDEETDRIVVHSAGRRFETRYLVACAGTAADRLTQLMDIEIDFQLIPFRGEFFTLQRRNDKIIRHLIYPIPDPDLPFLGVHLTRTIDGQITVGPNAVLSLSRDGYGKWDFNLGDVAEMLTYPGFWKLISQHFGPGVRELRDSWHKPSYLKSVQKFCPVITAQDLLPRAAGIRAQPVTRDGKMIDDFLFAESPRSLHVCNAPSPAATSSIPIGRHICDRVLERAG